MKIKTAFIIFAILVLSFMYLRSGTATTGQLPLPDKQISSAKAVPFRFLSCFGGSDVDDCDDIAVDADGCVYLACHSTSNDFPGSKQRDNSQDADRMDAYVSKIDPVAGKVIYTTRLGGSKWDGAIRIEVDQHSNAYVVGFTESSDFPTTSNALQREYIGGKSDAFLVKLKANGEIEYSTFFGGSDTDQGNALALDKAGNVYLAGTTWSNDLPGIEKGSSNKNSGHGDGFVAVWNLDQPSTLRAKYIGGKEVEKVTGIALDDSCNLFISGFTQSVDFPLHAALQKKLNGRQDAFLTKLRCTDLSYRFSTLIGGVGEDQAWGVAVDRAGRPYLAGGSDSVDFPTTTNALQRRYKGETDAFVTKFNATGTRMLYSTYLGGSGYDSCGYDGGDITIDRDGNAWVVGMTFSLDLPTANAIQTAYGGGDREGDNFRDGDGFVSVINPTGSLLLLSSYVGGNGRDFLEGIAPAPGGGVWATGLTGSRNLQTTSSLQKAYNGGLFDAMLIKIPVPRRKSAPR
ncbi:MAG TPA: SBBP repeat-containing protein [Pyrinomonadaceae bacterium]|nr:SBBP repeat-containing protein [Pyrinomonadaceae bacterium]